jgi:hypothetical protein
LERLAAALTEKARSMRFRRTTIRQEPKHMYVRLVRFGFGLGSNRQQRNWPLDLIPVINARPSAKK